MVQYKRQRLRRVRQLRGERMTSKDDELYGHLYKTTASTQAHNKSSSSSSSKSSKSSSSSANFLKDLRGVPSLIDVRRERKYVKRINGFGLEAYYENTVR